MNFIQSKGKTKQLMCLQTQVKRLMNRQLHINNGIETTLVMAKTRIALVKNSSLPQLIGAVIETRLSVHVNTVFCCQNIRFWLDSSIVLSWLTTKKPLKQFVANRNRKIQELIDEKL